MTKHYFIVELNIPKGESLKDLQNDIRDEFNSHQRNSFAVVTHGMDAAEITKVYTATPARIAKLASTKPFGFTTKMPKDNR